MKHPIQKTIIDDHGVLRFVKNSVIVLMLETLEKKGVDLNDLHNLGINEPLEDWDQFNQLIGYSVSGAPIAEEICVAATLAHETGQTIDAARADNAEALLNDIQLSLRDGIANLYGIHPDNLIVEPNPEVQRTPANE